MNDWVGDKLDRSKVAEHLTEYLVNRHSKLQSDTFVLAIDADWGLGKTFLLNNWCQDLEKDGYPVIYYDAWKNDFSDEPLIGFISEINSSLKSQFKKDGKKATELIEKTFSGAKKLIRPALITASQIAIKKLLNVTTDEIGAIFSSNSSSPDSKDQDKFDLSSVIDKCADEAIKQHESTKEAIENFKKQLASLVNHISGMTSKKLPIFIFIDELDRCRPSYSVELLENIKHLFGVNGVYFVIATNIKELSHSVNALYGQNFDSTRYLKKFFDQEYQLPKPDNLRYAKHLFDVLKLDNLGNYFTLLPSEFYQEAHEKNESPAYLFSLYSDAFRLTLRDQEQAATTLQTILITFKYKTIHLNYLIFLIMLRQRYSNFFNDYTNSKWKEIKTNLRNQLNENIQIKFYQYSGDQFSRKSISSIPLFILFEHYENISKIDLVELNKLEINRIDFPVGQIHTRLLEECPSSYYPNNSYPSSLDSYAKLVGQAGQLIN